MSLAEGVQGSIIYKAYSTGLITANTQPVSTVDPAVGSAQILRRVASTLKLTKATYQSNEVRADRQIQDFRHGYKKAEGGINGEFSPKTYFDFIEAAMRATKTSTITQTQAALTSVAFDSATSKITFTGGTPVTAGLRTGDIIRFTGLTVNTANNATNFLITAFSGTSNRILTVYPAPTTATADTTFSVTSNGTSGKAVFMPSSGFVSRKFGIEVNNNDVDISRLFTECRVGSWGVKLPATGMATTDIGFMGRDMEIYSGASAPFYTSPTAATTTGVFAAVNGLLQVGGTTVGVVTGLDITMNLNPTADAVVGQNFPPEVFLGRANVTGNCTAFFQDSTLISDFKNETQVSILAYLTTTSAANSPAVSIYLPSLKFGDGNVSDSGEGGQSISMPFQALKADGSVIGDEATTIRVVDTEAV
jgi:hypothetical protein